MDSVLLTSVNSAVAQPLDAGRGVRQTGHFKRARLEPVMVGQEGLAGDFIGNLKHHGGADQAVYLYSAEDNRWWQPLLGRQIEPGFFGENLTLDGWWLDPRVGDRLRFGELLLELTGPRTPCATLEARAGVRGLSRQFIRAERCGAYARVVEAGPVQTGTRGVLTRAPAHYPTIAQVFRYWHARGDDPRFLEAALAAPLASRIARTFRERLALATR